MYPPPHVFGFPDHYTQWREGQFDAIIRSKASQCRIVGQAAPTGFGKSHILVGEALMEEGRSLLLTSTKPLQDQYSDPARGFGDVLCDIRGQGNYQCAALRPGGEHYSPWTLANTTVEEGPCHFGVGCSLLLSGCTYYDRVRKARASQRVLTNYDLILSMNRYTEGLGNFDLICCDEAHELPEKMASSMTAEVSEWEAKHIIHSAFPNSDDPKDWARWASRGRVYLDRAADALKQSGDCPENRTKLKSLTRVRRMLDQMSHADDGWIVESFKDRVRVEPIWPAQFVEPYLFLGAKKIVFSSATMRPKTMNLMGLTEFDFFEYPSPFPVEQRPVIYVPLVDMHYGMTQDEELRWVTAVDQILSRRQDRKTVIHTVSYARQKFLLAHSQFSHLMLANSRTNVNETLKKFKLSKAPTVLVSPSMDTGVDFPGEECETVIIIKVPFPDTSSKIYKARKLQDMEYGPYIAAQSIVQMAGRGMRSITDRCETIIIDSVFGRMLSDYSHLFPNWFLTAVKRRDTLPSPLEKLHTI